MSLDKIYTGKNLLSAYVLLYLCCVLQHDVMFPLARIFLLVSFKWSVNTDLDMSAVSFF